MGAFIIARDDETCMRAMWPFTKLLWILVLEKHPAIKKLLTLLKIQGVSSYQGTRNMVSRMMRCVCVYSMSKCPPVDDNSADN